MNLISDKYLGDLLSLVLWVVCVAGSGGLVVVIMCEWLYVAVYIFLTVIKISTFIFLEGSSTIESGVTATVDSNQADTANQGASTNDGPPLPTDRDANPLEPFLALDESNRRLQGTSVPLSTPFLPLLTCYPQQCWKREDYLITFWVPLVPECTT